MSELKPCPNPVCGSGDVLIKGSLGRHFVECCHCGMRGPAGMAAVAARDDWNALPRTDYKGLAQELATVLLRYEKKLRYTSDEMDMDAVDVLLKARAAGLEVP
jgi:hypothetical protein